MKRGIVFGIAILMTLSLCACGAATRYYQQRADLYMYNERLDGFSRIGKDPKCYITVSGKQVALYYWDNVYAGEWLKGEGDQFVLWDVDPYIWADFKYNFTTMEKVPGGYNMTIDYTYDTDDGQRAYLEDRYQFRK